MPVLWQDHFCCSRYVETIVFLGKRSKSCFQLSNQWSIMQYLNFASEKIFFSAVSIYGLLFLRGFWRLLINCLTSKEVTFPSLLHIFSLQLFLHSSFDLQVVKILLFTLKISFLLFFSQPIISEYANKLSRKGIPSTRFAKYLAWVLPQHMN